MAQFTGTRDHDGALVLHRAFDQSAAHLWRWCVEATKLARWFGRWNGDPDTGEIQVVLLAEEGAPTQRVQILRCDLRGYELHVRTGDAQDAWRLELQIQAIESGSRLIFRMPGIDPAAAGSIGPGWEYYLDRLAAAVAGRDPHTVVFEPDYYPGLEEHYARLFGA